MEFGEWWLPRSNKGGVGCWVEGLGSKKTRKCDAGVARDVLAIGERNSSWSNYRAPECCYNEGLAAHLVNYGYEELTQAGRVASRAL